MPTIEELQKQVDELTKKHSESDAALKAKDEEIKKILAKNDELLTETKEAKRLKKEAEEKAAKEAAELAAKNGDVDALNKSWQEKIDKINAENAEKLANSEKHINKMLVDNVATKLATELAVQGSADILIPHIKSRLKTDIRDGEYVTVITDKDGKPSAFTLEDLKNEFISNSAFAPVIVASNASGGGADGKNKGGGATKKTLTRLQFEAMDDASRSAFAKDGGTVIN